MRILELFEIQGAEGPCLDAFGSGQTVQADETEGLRRWPQFAPRASAAGFRVMCAVPLRVRKSIIGALNLFRGTGPFSAADLEIAKAMADVAAIALIQERALRERALVTQQLETALHSRIVIEQAKGMLAEYLSTTVDRRVPAAQEVRARPQPQAHRRRPRRSRPGDLQSGDDREVLTVRKPSWSSTLSAGSRQSGVCLAGTDESGWRRWSLRRRRRRRV